MGKRSFAWTKNCIYRLWESKRGIDRWKECQGIIIRKFIEPNSIWWGQCEKKIFLYLLWHSFKRCTNDLFYPKNRRYNLGIKNPCRNTQILRNAFTQYKSDYGKFFSRSKQYFFSLVFLMRIITTNCNITKLWGRKKKQDLKNTEWVPLLSICVLENILRSNATFLDCDAIRDSGNIARSLIKKLLCKISICE